MTLFGKTRLNENSVIMHFQCIDNALQRVDNGSQRICKVNQSIVETLTMSENSEEWMKKLMFQNALATFSNV